MSDDKTCKGDHEGHMCLLASRKSFDEIQDLVVDPKFICFNCGRAAHSDTNLCNPMPLEKNA